MKIILIVMYIIFTITALILMKTGGNSGSIAIQNKEMRFEINLISLLGFVFYILSFLIFTKIITSFDLSYIYPIITGIVQILSLIASSVILKEKLSLQVVIGAIVIIVGIVCMNIKIPNS